MARTSARMVDEPVKLEDMGLPKWQHDARVDPLLAGVVVELLMNFLLLLCFCYYAEMSCFILISPSFLDHD